MKKEAPSLVHKQAATWVSEGKLCQLRAPDLIQETKNRVLNKNLYKPIKFFIIKMVAMN